MKPYSVFCESETLDEWSIEYMRDDVELNSFLHAANVHLSPDRCTIGELFIMRQNMELKPLNRPAWKACIEAAIHEDYLDNQAYYEAQRHAVLANCIKD